jgi:hypothetical protein
MTQIGWHFNGPSGKPEVFMPSDGSERSIEIMRTLIGNSPAVTPVYDNDNDDVPAP